MAFKISFPHSFVNFLKPNINNVKSICDIELISPKEEETKENGLILFSPKENDLCQTLNSGMKLNIAFTLKPNIREVSSQPEESISTRLGAIAIEWAPIPLRLSNEMVVNTDDEYQYYHGPLAVKKTRLLKQKGPLCHVEEAPFKASFETIPAMPKVGNPFEVRYEITNKTSNHQRLRVLMNDSESVVSSNSMLVSGIINGEVALGPLEKKILNYSLLVTKVGKTTIPAFDVSSIRYNTWVVRGSCKIFVSP